MTIQPTATATHHLQGRRHACAEASPREVAQYIADITLELRNLAKAAKLKTLQGLLELTFYEAFSAANPVIISQEERERLQELELEGKAKKNAIF